MTLMRGATLVRQGVMNYLSSVMEDRRTLAIQQWGITAAELPPIEKFLTYEPTALGHGSGPLMAINVANANNLRLVDLEDWENEHYEVMYRVRLYLWCYTPVTPDYSVPPEEEVRISTTRQRDDLAGLVRSTLLERLSLGQPDAFELQPGSLEESYSELSPVPNASGRMAAGAFFNFNLKFDESLYRPQIGEVPEEGVDVEVYKIPIGE